MPLSLQRELEIERELDAIIRELDRCLPRVEESGSTQPEQIEMPWAPPLLLDLD